MRSKTIAQKAKIASVLLLIIAFITTVIVLAIVALQAPVSAPQPTQPAAQPKPQLKAPTLKTEVIIGGLKNAWDIAFLPDQSMLVTERAGRVVHKIPGQKEHALAQIADVRASGEGGLMGLAIDVDYSKNHYIYTCFASQSSDVRLVRWVLTEAGLTQRKDIITGIPLAASGRHSGCRVAMDKTGVLWVGTGDAAQAANPQNPKNLGGKILRITRDGAPASGNIGGQFDARVYSYGHRNTQGLALFDTPQQGVAGFSVEHGSNIDDEVNKLVPGNFGWNPTPPYIENVPMTDKTKYPDAIDAVWSSGGSTIAPSGAALLSGKHWQAWQGALAVAVLKNQHIRIQKYNKNVALTHDEIILQNQFGRLRSLTLGPDGNIYATTDNTVNDQVIRITPQ